MRSEGSPISENASQDLRAESVVVDLMRSSKTEREWNSNEDKVMAANGGDHPEFWDTKIIDSGLAKEVGRAITAKEELDRKNALRARQREKGY